VSGEAIQLPPLRRDIEGTYNLRDVGGRPAADGRRTRTGVLYRSDALGGLTAAGREALRALGLRTIVDLRSSEELAASPSAIEGLGVTVQHLPVFAGSAPGSQAAQPAALDEIYHAMIDGTGPKLASAVRAISAGAAEGAVLVHCTAGKDRTGVVVALTLEAVGVDREAVVADYAASEANLAGEWAEAMLLRIGARSAPDGVDLVGIVTTSPAPPMEQLLARLDREHGGARAYLASHGMSEAELDALAEALTESL